MSTEKNKTPEHNEFVPGLLMAFTAIEPKRVTEVRNFFSESFLMLSDHALFDDPDFRKSYANNVNYLNELGDYMNRFTHQQVSDGIADAISKLEEKEAGNG